MKTNIAIKEWELLNLRRNADRYSESNIELVAHTQTLTKQPNSRNHHIPLSIITEC
jgi:hypothetical protein